MEYLLLIYEDEKRYETASEAELGMVLADYNAFGKAHAGIIKGGNALQPTNVAKTVRVRAGKAAVTDGPFAETKEQLGGYYLVNAESVDDALRAAANIPGARSGCIEVRPIMTFS